MIRSFSRPYTSHDRIATVTQFDTAMFIQRYFMHCLDCQFCHDSCCSYGATIDIENVKRLEARAPELEAYLGVSRDRWFTDEYAPDSDYVGGQYTRTQVVATPRGNRCVFLNRGKRGCGIHSFCLDNGLDYHDLKPMVCWFFPIMYDHGLLRPAHELQTGELICIDQGETLYRASRSEIAYYFGDELIAELDRIEAEPLNSLAN
ncbi:MAG: DUF3109 family protein [Aggregatilineales bacterium]